MHTISAAVSHDFPPPKIPHPKTQGLTGASLAPNVQSMNRPIAPANPLQLQGFGAADGSIIAHAGRYARETVLVAFEMIGGVDRMAAWAEDNPGEFYTKLFTKVITREVEVSAGAGIEELLMQLDRRPALQEQNQTIDAEYEIE